MIVDSHCHASDRWFEPVETLVFQMDRHGVQRAVLTQLLGQYDNGYQQACVRRDPARFASVVAVDVSRPDAVAQLRKLAGDGATGLRLRPGDRSPGEDPLALWRAAAGLGLTVSCVGSSQAFAAPEFAELVAQLPTLPIVLEHLAGTSSPDADDEARALRRRALALARFPNVHLKLPGLGELVPRPRLGVFDRDGPHLTDCGPVGDALALFGAARVLWGSDHPVVASREGYAQALRWCRAVVDALAPGAGPAIFGQNANRLFFRHG